MNKNDIKRLLMSMRNTENDSKINNLLGKIDLLSEEKIESMITQIGDDEENIRKYLQEKLNTQQNNEHQKHTPINEMFAYGISGGSIHLHMPIDLHQMMSEKGIVKTIDTVNLFLLDAIEKIRKMQNNGYYKFIGKDSIYMISPILFGTEIKFLNELDFITHIYKKKELNDDQFVTEHPEAQLATHIFGKEKNVGTAIIGIDVINTSEWEEKRISKIELFRKKGITLEQKEKGKE